MTQVAQKKQDVVFSFYAGDEPTLMHKHFRFWRTAMLAAYGRNDYRIFNFGGGIRGGKTFTCLYTLYTIAQAFPGTKIHIVRESTPSLNRTIKPSFFKIVRSYKKYNENKNFVELHNGSVFFFLAEQIEKDRDLDRFKGLETNIFLLEQIEELDKKTFEKAKERAGTHIFLGAPMPLIFTTFNPTHVKWVRELIYTPFVENRIEPYMYTEMVTARDNPHIPRQQWEMWATIDPVMYNQYVVGDWEIVSSEKAFFYNFKNTLHVQDCEFSKEETVALSFDFNVDPLVCVAAHFGENFLHVFKEFKTNKGIQDLLNQIISYFPAETHFLVTGDAAGHARSIFLQHESTAYTIIMKELGLTRHQIKTPRRNLYLRDSRALCNSVIQSIDFKISPTCKNTIEDLLTVEADYKGEIDRNVAINKRQNPEKSHFLDTVRYLIHTFFFDKFKNQLLTYDANNE